ncbi:hypothetical protein JZ751_021778, partial [Albula glossodonta]
SSRSECLRFEVEGVQVGWVPPTVAPALSRFPKVFTPPQEGAITLCPGLESYNSRSSAKYEVMARFCDSPFMCMERAATSLFGVKRYGVHVNGYTRDKDGTVRMWLARRSPTKQTYPGRLDNLAAGGLASGTGVRQTMIKECQEEACIPECIAENAHPVGTISYTYEDEEGVFPECQFVFDLELPPEFMPRIGDGEVQDFYLWPIEKVKDVIVTDDFKPNCAMVVLDFLIRHSFIQPDTERFYQELMTGLHRSL